MTETWLFNRYVFNSFYFSDFSCFEQENLGGISMRQKIKLMEMISCMDTSY